MMEATERSAPQNQSDPAALMYPGNQLKEQVRSYEETFSAFTVLRETFFNHEI